MKNISENQLFSTKILRFSLGLTLFVLCAFLTNRVRAVETGKDLILYLNFDEGAGELAKDGSGNGNNGVIKGAAWEEGYNGLGHSLRFLNSSKSRENSVNVNFSLSEISPDKLTAFTIEWWMKHETEPSEPYAWQVWRFENGFSMWNLNPGNWYFTKDIGYPEIQEWETCFKIPLGRWNHIALVVDKNSWKTYLNGEKKVERMVTKGKLNAPGPLHIGFSRDCCRGYDGLIDEFKIYKQALSEEEVKREAQSISVLPQGKKADKMKDPWATFLPGAGGSFWSKRILVEVKNDKETTATEPKIITIGKGKDKIDLAGVDVREIRSTERTGLPLPFAVLDGQIRPKNIGSLQEGDKIAFSFKVPPVSSVPVYFYYGNKKAEYQNFWEVPPVEKEGKTGQETFIFYPSEEKKISVLAKPFSWIKEPQLWKERVEVKFSSINRKEIKRHPVAIRIRELLSSNFYKSLSVVDGANGEEIPSLILKTENVSCLSGDDFLFFLADLPADSLKSYYIYLSKNEITNSKKLSYEDLISNPANLISNASFEEELKGWTFFSADTNEKSPQDVASFSRGGEGKTGEYCAELVIPSSSVPIKWRGWSLSEIPLKTGDYFYGGFLKRKDIKGENATLEIYVGGGRDKGRRVFDRAGFGTFDWKFAFKLFNVSEGERRTATVFLGMNATGSLYYDGLFLFPVLDYKVGKVEGKVRLIRPDGQDGLRGGEYLPLRLIAPEETEKIAATLINPDGGRAGKTFSLAHQGTDRWVNEKSYQFQPNDLPGIWKVEYEVTDNKDLKETGQVEFCRQFSIWTETPLKKVFLNQKGEGIHEPLLVSLAKNEYEPMQLVITAAADLKRVILKTEPPRNKEGKELGMTADLVNYVNVKENIGSDGWPGLWPDPLPPYRGPFSIRSGENQPLWITIHASKEAAAGEYKGKITIETGENGASLTLPFTVNVWDFALPEETTLKSVFDNPFIWDESYYYNMAAHRVSPQRTPPDYKAGYKDGVVKIDFATFDKWAHFFLDELKFNVLDLGGNVFQPLNYSGLKRYTPEYYDGETKILQQMIPHLKEKGWYDKAVITIQDEPHFQYLWGATNIYKNMREEAAVIRKVDPNLKILTSCPPIPELYGVLDIWECFPASWFNPNVQWNKNTVKERIAKGEKVWVSMDWSYCIDTPYLTIERSLPYACWDYGITGIDYWGVSWFFDKKVPADRWKTPDQSATLPNGDGYFLYAGEPVGVKGPVNSIRWEELRDGIEDYEYFVILKRLMDEAEKKGLSVATARNLLQQVSLIGEAWSSENYPKQDHSTLLKIDIKEIFSLRGKIALEIVHLRNLLKKK